MQEEGEIVIAFEVLVSQEQDAWRAEQVTGDFGQLVHAPRRASPGVGKLSQEEAQAAERADGLAKGKGKTMHHKWNKQRSRSKRSDYSVLPRVCFGGKFRPLVWGRSSATAGRRGAAILAVKKSRLQIYLDDPLFNLQGPAKTHNKAFAVTLLTWCACGLRIAEHKGQRGAQVDWIGLLLRLDAQKKKLHIKIPDNMSKDLNTPTVTKEDITADACP